jgi:hypothetical protein
MVQETYLRAWRSYGTFEGRSSVRTWRVIVLTVTSAGISHIVSFGDPALLPKFGVPMVLRPGLRTSDVSCHLAYEFLKVA